MVVRIIESKTAEYLPNEPKTYCTVARGKDYAERLKENQTQEAGNIIQQVAGDMDYHAKRSRKAWIPNMLQEFASGAAGVQDYCKGCKEKCKYAVL